MAVGDVQSTRGRHLVAGIALFAAQIFHGFTPADTESDSAMGFFAGNILLMANILAVAGIWGERRWAPRLLGFTGLAVAAGFVLYHGLPFRSPLTNPYPGEGVGFLPWLTVVVTVVAGLWCAVETRPWRSHPRLPRTP